MQSGYDMRTERQEFGKRFIQNIAKGLYRIGAGTLAMAISPFAGFESRVSNRQKQGNRASNAASTTEKDKKL